MQEDVEGPDGDAERLGARRPLPSLEEPQPERLGVPGREGGERLADPLPGPPELLGGDHLGLRARRAVGDVSEEPREVRNGYLAGSPPETLQGRPARDRREPVEEADPPPLEVPEPLHGPQPRLGEDLLRLGRSHARPDDGVEEETPGPVVENPGALAVAAAHSLEEAGVIVVHPFRRLYAEGSPSLTPLPGPRGV